MQAAPPDDPADAHHEAELMEADPAEPDMAARCAPAFSCSIMRFDLLTDYERRNAAGFYHACH